MGGNRHQARLVLFPPSPHAHQLHALVSLGERIGKALGRRIRKKSGGRLGWDLKARDGDRTCGILDCQNKEFVSRLKSLSVCLPMLRMDSLSTGIVLFCVYAWGQELY